jgi:hypothetical protein
MTDGLRVLDYALPIGKCSYSSSNRLHHLSESTCRFVAPNHSFSCDKRRYCSGAWCNLLPPISQVLSSFSLSLYDVMTMTAVATRPVLRFSFPNRRLTKLSESVLCGSHVRWHVFRHSLFSRLQAAPIVSITRITTESVPSVLDRRCFAPLDQPAVDQKVGYLSFYFRTHGARSRKAYTFIIPKGQDSIEVLMSYASIMACHGRNEYFDAFQGYVEKLRTGDILLPPSRRAKELKAPKPKYLSPGKERDEEIELRLRQGQSFVDMESSLQKTAIFLAREANRIMGKNELENLLRQKKREQWSDEEVQRLIALQKQRLPFSKFTLLLRRTESNIRKKFQELRCTSSLVVEGPQELPPELEMLMFNTRLSEVWQALLKSEMTPTWREALQEKPAEEWLSSISLGIPEDVKKALGGLRPPTWDELNKLSLIDTNDAGVYARLVTSRHQLPTTEDRYLYVGSASRYGSGLSGRMAEHTRKVYKLKDETRLQFDIRRKKLKGNGRFITLMVMKMDSPKNEDVLNVRRTVTLAEAILTVWLSALQSPSQDLQSACPWDMQTLQYTGWASHNPLMKDVVLPVYRKTDPAQGVM